MQFTRLCSNDAQLFLSMHGQDPFSALVRFPAKKYNFTQMKKQELKNENILKLKIATMKMALNIFTIHVLFLTS